MRGPALLLAGHDRGAAAEDIKVVAPGSLVLHLSVRAAIVQFCPGAVRAENMRAADAMIRQGVQAHVPDLIALPEMWTCLGGDRAQKRSQAETLPQPGAPAEDGTAYAFLQNMARRHAICIHGGSIGEREGEQLFNTSLLFDAQGREVARYRKIHLFDVTTPNGQGYRESALFGAGAHVVTARLAGMCLGLTICYDLRFAELFTSLVTKGAEVIFVPSAFTAQTGRDHWEVLLRARAIETQSWIVAPATTGAHQDAQGARRLTWGHSLIVDPWGRVAASLGDEPGVTAATLDAAAVQRVRAAMPVAQHRRLA